MGGVRRRERSGRETYTERQREKRGERERERRERQREREGEEAEDLGCLPTLLCVLYLQAARAGDVSKREETEYAKERLLRGEGMIERCVVCARACVHARVCESTLKRKDESNMKLPPSSSLLLSLPLSLPLSSSLFLSPLLCSSPLPLPFP